MELASCPIIHSGESGIIAFARFGPGPVASSRREKFCTIFSLSVLDRVAFRLLNLGYLDRIYERI
jgi:hypothetical protein